MNRKLLLWLLLLGVGMTSGGANAQVVAKQLPIISESKRTGDLDVNAPGVIRLRLVRSPGSWSLAITDPAGQETLVTDANVGRYRVYADTIEVPVASSGLLHAAATGALAAVTWESLIPATSGQQRFRQGGPLERIDADFRRDPANRMVAGWSDAVVRVRWSGSSLATRWCTGVQVAAGRILTNRHCLPPGYDIKAPVGEVAVQFGAFSNSLDDIADTVPARVTVAERSTSSSEIYDRDVAVLTLDRTPTPGVYGNAIIPLSDGSMTGRPAMLLSVWGYDLPYGKVVSRGPKCLVEIEQQAAWNCYKPIGFYHQCETEEGSSGSPVVDATTGQLVGLHYAGLAEGGGNCALRVEEIRALFR